MCFIALLFILPLVVNIVAFSSTGHLKEGVGRVTSSGITYGWL